MSDHADDKTSEADHHRDKRIAEGLGEGTPGWQNARRFLAAVRAHPGGFVAWLMAKLFGIAIGAAAVWAAVLLAGAAFDEGKRLYEPLKCRRSLQADLDEGLWDRQPKVLTCRAPGPSAWCMVEMLSEGQRKTATVQVNCSERQVPDGYWNLAHELGPKLGDISEQVFRRNYHLSKKAALNAADFVQAFQFAWGAELLVR